MVPARTLILLLILAALSGCSPAPVTSPTQAQTVPASPAPSQLPTTGSIRAPTRTAMPLSPTAAERPTAQATAAPAPSATPEPAAPLFSYPIGAPGKPFGDGFFIRHGDQAENTWYNPGYWHTGEDWYAVTGDTAGARVYAIAAGEVVYAGGNYPGRVVIVRHAADLYSMYGHLDWQLSTQAGAQVLRGQQIGTVLRRSDTTPSHLHFEVRTFLTARAVNGSAPRYGFRCGVSCPPGPGYWPIQAPDLPSDLGWRTPAHVITQRMYPPGAARPLGQVVVASHLISQSVALWSGPPGDSTRSVLNSLALRSGERFALLDVRAGPEDTHETSALGYLLWYAIGLPDGRTAWVQAAIPSTFETGGDGRPSSIYFNFFPAVDTPS
jgi:murein DD-endopeptidase MepM/ murein hydrolase activator NlpD